MGETAEQEDESPAEDLLTVEQLNGRIENIIDSTGAFHGVRCIGEVMNVSESDVALYFTLTDGEHELSCVVWESRYRNMEVNIEDGQEVILGGSIDYWTEGGKISLKPWQVSEVGEGDRAAALDRLERELEERGWFDDERKQWPPEFPEQIGVVTSLDGDARYDIQSAIHGQDPTVNLLIKDATVQGPQAPQTLIVGSQSGFARVVPSVSTPWTPWVRNRCNGFALSSICSREISTPSMGINVGSRSKIFQV